MIEIMRLSVDRGLVDRRLNPAQTRISEYVYRVIAWIDHQRVGYKTEIKVSFFDQEKSPIHKCGGASNPILVCFKNGTFQVLPATTNGEHAKIYLGVKYTQISCWGYLPFPRTAYNPGTESTWDNFWTASENITEIGDGGEKDQFDFYYIWRNGLTGATNFVSNLASLWRKGYVTILSLITEQTKSLTASETNSENSN